MMVTDNEICELVFMGKVDKSIANFNNGATSPKIEKH